MKIMQIFFWGGANDEDELQKQLFLLLSLFNNEAEINSELFFQMNHHSIYI